MLHCIDKLVSNFVRDWGWACKNLQALNKKNDLKIFLKCFLMITVSRMSNTGMVGGFDFYLYEKLIMIPPQQIKRDA